jgi:hypothetical protein
MIFPGFFVTLVLAPREAQINIELASAQLGLQAEIRELSRWPMKIA